MNYVGKVVEFVVNGTFWKIRDWLALLGLDMAK